MRGTPGPFLRILLVGAASVCVGACDATTGTGGPIRDNADLVDAAQYQVLASTAQSLSREVQALAALEGLGADALSDSDLAPVFDTYQARNPGLTIVRSARGIELRLSPVGAATNAHCVVLASSVSDHAGPC